MTTLATQVAAKVADLLTRFAATETAVPAGPGQVTVTRAQVANLLAARAAVEVAEREKNRVEAEFKAVLGDAVEALVDGQVVVTYEPIAPKRLNQKRLAAERPDIVEAYREPVPTRPLLVKSKVLAALGLL